MTDTTGFSLRGLLADTTPVIWLITAAWTLLLCLWSVLPPLFHAPDEPQHVDAILDAVGRPPLVWVTPTGDVMDTAVVEAEEQYGYLARDPANSDLFLADRRTDGRRAVDALPREARPSYAELQFSDRLPSTRVNQMYQHPPLYYRLASWVVGQVPDWQDVAFDRLVGGMRLLSAAMMALLPMIMAALARAFDDRPGIEHASALSPFVLPQLAHIGSVTSNDGLLVTLSALLTLLLVRVHRGDLSPRTSYWTGGVLLAALLTKGFALFLVLAVLAAHVGAVRVSGRGVRAAVSSLVRVGGVAAASVLWYGENFLRFDSLQPSVAPPPLADVHGPVGDWLRRVWIIQTQTFWGRIGWTETGFSEAAATWLSVVFVLVVLVGVRGRTSSQLTTLLLPGSLIVAITVVQSWAYFDTDRTIRAVHGRYFWVSLAGLLVVAAAGAQRLLRQRHLERWTWVAVLGAAVWLHAVTVTTAVRHFWTTPEASSLLDGGRTLLVWQPWPPRLVMAIGALFVLSGLEVVRRLVLLSRRTAVTAPLAEQERAEADDDQHGVTA